MKKFLAVLLVVMMVLSMAACGEKTPAENTSNGTETNTTENTTENTTSNETPEENTTTETGKKDLIAIDQDPLGIQGLRLKKDGDLQYWFKPLENGDWAFCLLNGGPDALNVVLKWSDLDFVDDLSQRAIDFAGTNYTVKDLWHADAKPVNTLSKGKGKNRGKMVSNTFNVTVASHDVAVYRLSPVPSKKK